MKPVGSQNGQQKWRSIKISLFVFNEKIEAYRNNILHIIRVHLPHITLDNILQTAYINNVCVTILIPRGLNTIVIIQIEEDFLHQKPY